MASRCSVKCAPRHAAADKNWSGDSIEGAGRAHDVLGDRNDGADPPVAVDQRRRSERLDFPALLLQSRKPVRFELHRERFDAFLERILQTAVEQFAEHGAAEAATVAALAFD